MNNRNNIYNSDKDPYWQKAYARFIDEISYKQCIDPVHQLVFKNEYTRNQLLNFAIEKGNSKFITMFLDYFNVPKESLSLKQRLALYKLTGVY